MTKIRTILRLSPTLYNCMICRKIPRQSLSWSNSRFGRGSSTQSISARTKFSSDNQKWLLFPFTAAAVCDEVRSGTHLFTDAGAFSDGLESLFRQHFDVLWFSFVVGGTELGSHSASLAFCLDRTQIRRKKPFSFDLALRYSAESFSEQGLILGVSVIFGE